MDQTLLHKRKRRSQQLSLGKTLTLENQDCCVLVRTKVGFAHNSLLLKIPNMPGLIPQMWFIVCRGCIRRFYFQGDKFHLRLD